MHRSTVVYQFDDVILNSGTFSVQKSGRALALEPRCIRLLLYLIHNRSRAIGKEELLSNIWEDVAVSDNALARVVAQLRKALGDDAKVARYIETVPTVGYRFIAEVVELPPAGGVGSPERAPGSRHLLPIAATGVALLAIRPKSKSDSSHVSAWGHGESRI
jgi:DNA-binding winged helix-turn-helix (wHTH) protein